MCGAVIQCGLSGGRYIHAIYSFYIYLKRRGEIVSLPFQFNTCIQSSTGIATREPFQIQIYVMHDDTLIMQTDQKNTQTPTTTSHNDILQISFMYIYQPVQPSEEESFYPSQTNQCQHCH